MLFSYFIIIIFDLPIFDSSCFLSAFIFLYQIQGNFILFAVQ